MKGENIQKLLDFIFIKFTSDPHQGDLRAVACEGNDRWKLKTMTKHHLCKENNLCFFFLREAKKLLYQVSE